MPFASEHGRQHPVRDLEKQLAWVGSCGKKE
jgi:hypothetical protein